MRPSSPDLARAFARGAAAHGLDVTLIGLCSTDGLYYASGALGVPGAMFTASHNPARYNGIKLCRSQARPVGQDSGLAEVRDLAQQLLDTGAERAGRRAPGAGTVTERDLLGDYAAFLRGLVDLSGSRPLKVVVDAGNGMGGHTVPAVLGTAAGVSTALPAAAGRRTAVLRAGRHVPQPRGQPAGAGEPARPAAGGRRARRRHRARLRRRRRPVLRGRRARRAGQPQRHHGAGRDPRDRQGAGRGPGRRGRGRRPQRHLLRSRRRDHPRARRAAGPHPGRATPSSRARWRATRRCSAGSTRRTTTSATSGTPTPACSPPCTSWPRSVSRTARCPSWCAAFSRYVASGEINSTVADAGAATAAVRAVGGRPGRDASTSWTG